MHMVSHVLTHTHTHTSTCSSLGVPSWEGLVTRHENRGIPMGIYDLLKPNKIKKDYKIKLNKEAS